MLDYRTWGDTRNCKGCRFWSEMVAHSQGSQTAALCLNKQSRNSAKFVVASVTCDQWQEGSLGAVDDPGGNPYEGG